MIYLPLIVIFLLVGHTLIWLRSYKKKERTRDYYFIIFVLTAVSFFINIYTFFLIKGMGYKF